MGASTGIAWTDSTINVWHGCTKVDPLCKHCYAEVSTPVRVKRAGGLEVWGPDAARSETRSWRTDLRRWNRQALASGEVRRVFGQSLSDTFEDYHGGRLVYADGSVSNTTLDGLRLDFLALAAECSALTFQLLTKRPENVCRMVPPAWLTSWPRNVWVGASVGTQASADERIPHLLRIPAPVRFLSVEPQLEAVDLRLRPATIEGLTSLVGSWRSTDELAAKLSRLDLHAGVAWVIQGGESGPKARPFDLAWARSMRDACKAASVPYFLKQLGAQPAGFAAEVTGSFPLRDSHSGDESEWPADLRGCRAFPEVRP